jgi:hypothetical protein
VSPLLILKFSFFIFQFSLIGGSGANGISTNEAKTMATKRNRRRRPRRGIVLLIVISLLVMFMLILVTFAVVSGHYRNAATSSAWRKALQVKFAENNAVVDDILSMLLSEPNSASSSLWGVSLLGDMYGDSINGFIGAIPNPQPNTVFVEFNGIRDPDPTQPFPNAQFANSEGFYVGCVITMKDGPCAGLSSRITHYYPGNRPTWLPPTPPGGYSVDDGVMPGLAADPIALRMEAFENGLTPQQGNHFVINGKPFNGTGVGRPLSGEYANYAVTTIGTMNCPWALMPHLAGWSNRPIARQALAGGADEPWDTFDFHNMFLALVPSDPTGPQIIKPSYHDQALLAYWNNFVDQSDNGTVDGSASLFDPAHTDLLRQIMFRPLRADHPNFDGSNPLYAQFTMAGATGNYWDVDNDKDGIPDSIWIDPGLPVATAPDGRKYKRLVAIMIRDLDGRVNINAAGSVEFAAAATFSPPGVLPQAPFPAQPGAPLPDPIPGGPTEPLAGSPPFPSYFPRGLGYGPAEINPLNLFQLDGESLDVAAASYRRLFQGTASSPLPPNPVAAEGIPGKYGIDLFYTPSGARTSIPFNRRPGIWGPNGIAPSNDILSVVKTQGFGLDYTGGVFSNYASPTDVWGRGAIALDYSGQPYPYEQGQPTDWIKDTNQSTIPSPPMPLGPQQTAEINDNPYEINLIDGPQSYDAPYTVAEQEALLRRFDPDVDALPPRLYQFLSTRVDNSSVSALSLARRINTLTTLGSSNNAPRGALPYYMRNNPTNGMNWANYGNPAGGSILDICGARVAAEVFNQTGTAPIESVKQTVVKQIMPFEFYHGEMFNLNRPFGNGVDDDGNGVVDEPGETNNNAPGFAATEQAWTAGAFAIAPAAGGGAWPLNDAQNHWWYPPSGAPMAYTNPGYPNSLINGDPHLFARQLYARHLYCMLLLFCDPNYVTATMPATVTESLGPAQLQALFCRRMAQFAINAVDNRDPDAIMTPFEFDLNPWDGWNVDGDLTTDETAWDASVVRGVVWGMEQQDLVLKETISFHDRRVRDTANDMPAQDRAGGDNDVDQLRLPEGSTILELYCSRARTLNNPKLPVELYDPVTGRLDVARMTGVSSYDNAVHPVWQIAISGYMGALGTDTRPNTLVGTYPDSFSLEPTLDPTGANAIRTNLFDPTQTIPIERFVWFSNVEPAAATNMTDRTFINAAGWDVSLDPGSYLVVGPRASTVLGSLDMDPNPTPLYEGPSAQSINLSIAAGVAISNIAAGQTSLTPGAQIRQAKAMIADLHSPRGGVNTIDGGATTWPAGGRRIGLNVTEPLPQSGIYYTYPTEANDAYDDLATPMGTLPDAPFDSNAGAPLSANNMLVSQTYLRTHTIVLQRLANPTQPWHPVINPYINLDWAENDTTVFTGDENTNRQVMVMAANQDVDPDDPIAGRQPMVFRTRQRGNMYVAPASPPAFRDVGNGLLWNPQTNDPAPATAVAMTAGTYFRYDLIHTLGFVNGTYSDPAGSGAEECTWAVTPGFKLNGGIASPLWNPAVAKRVGTDANVPPAYVGEPSVPFPWITWNNRPYANPMELLNVPTSSPQRLGQEFFYNFSGNVLNTYDPGAAPLPPLKQGFYWHLANFFQSTVYDPTGSGSVRVGTDFHRLFDFVETPSPYVGTETWYGPAAVNATPGSPVTFQDPGTGYRAPFNRLSRGRDPGKININTVVDPLVWDAIVSTYPEMQSAAAAWPNSPTPGTNLFMQMLYTRRGYPVLATDPPDNNTTADMFRGNPNYPTIFANPFRPADAFDLQPVAQMQLNRPVDATLLRGNSTPLPVDGVPASATPGPLPMLNYNGYDAGDLSNPATYVNLSRATDRNSYFRNQPLGKVANMLTTNSNTFAVWMTVGYFEVTENPGGIDIAHPDGKQLGQEMQFDGAIRRPRAFFLIDRTIPVGFEPGKSLNTDKCVLQRRYIE